MSFAKLSPERRREIGRKGGQAAHSSGRAHKFTSEEAKIAGRKGGLILSQDREYMRKIGTRGGMVTASVRGHMSKIGKLSRGKSDLP